RRLLLGSLEIRIETPAGAPLRLAAGGVEQLVDPRRHESTVEPKGATLTALRVAREEDGWVAQCVVDV
ncbi:MAG TPA: archease, partial [Thermoanaerobaculia bacterium]|nr:archease [Thermoanaerobaculia bacterium]